MLSFALLRTSFTGTWIWVQILAQLISGVTMPPNSGRSRLALSFLWLTAIVILASYSGTLMSYLAVDIRTLPFTSLKQVMLSPLYNIWMDTESIYAEIFGVSIYMHHLIHIGRGRRYVLLKIALIFIVAHLCAHIYVANSYWLFQVRWK